VTHVKKSRSKQYEVRGEVIISKDKVLPEKQIRYVYNLIQFPKKLIPRNEWSGVSTDGYALDTRRVCLKLLCFKINVLWFL
jgi:hypothetical protein